MSKISWEELLNLITSSGEVTCSVRLLDTVFINQQNNGNRLNSWYFTTKNGIISKKKYEKSTIDAITTRFHRFSMSNPNNALQYVGTIVKDDGSRQYLTEDELTNYFSLESNLDNQNSSFLQVYLRPYDGIDQIVKGTYQNGNENFQFTVQTAAGGSCELKTLPESSFIRDQCTIFTKEILKSLRVLNLSAEPLADLQMEFIIDDNKHVWLSKISQTNETQAPDQLSSSLPELPNSSQSSRKTQATPSHSSIMSPAEKLLWREGGVPL
jgi:hypothetical protein